MKKYILRSLLFVCVLALACTVLPLSARAETDGDWEYSVSSGVATVTKYTGTDTVVTVPNMFGSYQVTTIGESAFEGNATMTEIHFPTGLTTIQAKAFKGCVGLTSVTLPKRLTSLGARAFQNCTQLSEIIVESTNLADIGEDYPNYGMPFYGAGSAAENGIAVTFDQGCTVVPARIFHARDGVGSAAYITSVSIANSVTSIRDQAFQGSVYLETVDCGNGVTGINSRAFGDCTALREITFSNTLKSIGEYAFSGCSALDNVTFPKSLTGIGKYAFQACVSFTEIELPVRLASLAARAFQNCTNVTQITVNSTSLADIALDYPEYGQPFYGAGTAGDGIAVTFADGGTRVPANLFYAYSGATAAANVTSLTMADTVKEVAGSAFRGCVYLETVDLGNGVGSIAGHVFDDCASLKEITWSNKLDTIGSSAFANCKTLEKLAFPASLTAIGESAFSGCAVLTDIAFPEGLTSIGKYGFSGCVALAKVELPKKLSSLGARSFGGCTGLEELTVYSTSMQDIGLNYPEYGQPFYGAGTAGNGIAVTFADGCTRVPANLFYAYGGSASAANVTSVTMADTVKEVAGSAFRGCVYLETVNLGNGVGSIAGYAFNGCTDLTAVDFSSSLISIGESAFRGCAKLENVKLPSGLTSIGGYAFADCVAFTEITLPEKLASLAPRAFQNCTGVTGITVKSTNLKDISVTYSEYGQPFYGVGTAADGIDVVIAEGVTRIPGGLFYAYSGAAYAPTIVSVTVGNDVNEIGSNAFTNCGMLTSITFEGMDPDTIKDNVFTGVVATAYHPGWPVEKQLDYGGDITWVGYSGCDHAETKLENVKTASCQEAGYTGDTVCVSCGKVVQAGEATPMTDHTWDAGEITQEPTAAAPGIKTYTCELCGETKTEEIDFLCDHADTELQNVETATCEEPGYTGDTVCLTCGEILSQGQETPLAEHTWDAGEITQMPTVDVPGIKTYTCDVCGDTKTEEVEFVCNHADTELQNVETATCEEPGYTGDTVCLTCGQILSQGQETPLADHTWDAGEITQKPTVTDTGVKTYTCTVCFETKEEEIPVLSHTHSYGAWKTVTAATCEREGLQERVCACGDTQEQIIPMLDHDYNDKGVCTECGQKDPNKPSDPVVPAGQVIRLAGDDRYKTAFAIADELKEVWGVDKFDTVILANSSNFADALAGSYLAAVKNAPILLAKEKYAGIVCDYLNQNLEDGGKIYFLGGEDVMPLSILNGLKVDYSFKRLSGDDRYATNLAILEHAPIGSSDLLVATGRDFADSLSASATGLPILLVNSKAGKTLSAEQKEFLRSVTGDIYIIGGESAVSESFERQIRSVVGSRVDVSRISGASRYETSVEIAKKFLPDAETAVVAFAGDYPDGLCGGPLAYATESPLILTKNGKNEAPNYTNSRGITSGYVLGSENLISDTSVKIIFGNGPSSDDAGSTGGNTGTTFTVTFNTQGGSIVAAQKVEKGKTAAEPAEPEKSGNLFMGWYLSGNPENLNEPFAFAATPINADTTLYAAWMDLTDTDGDLLVDELEKQYGTDINEQDTDGDTVSDYIEVVVLGTDPLKKDGYLDTDGDGLTNAEEIGLGTNPGDADTDADMLSDAEELDLGTDPCNYDTDGDGVSDGKEVELGTDPLTAQSTFQVEKTSTVEDSVTPSVEMKLSGSQVESLSVEPIADSHLFPEDMPGYMGKAYSFRVDGQFDEATIKFTFDPDSLPEGSTPAIFFFNEVTQTLEELATTIVGNVASAVVEHFSTYVLIDRTVYYDSFRWEDVWSAEGIYDGLEIVLVIDDSGSMDWNDENNQRLSVAQNLIDNLPENSKIGIVKFENSTTMLTTVLTEDREEAKNYLTTDHFYSYGGTYMYDAIEDSFPLLENTDETILKMMVVLSDGDSSNLSKHSGVVDAAVAENIRIYTIGLGNSTSYFTRYLQPLAEGTGGEFYLAANADELTVIYDDISKEIDIHTDSDGDGIPDHYEDHMVAFNGKAIKLDKNEKDTDGDGLLDGEEVEVVLTYNDDKTKVYVKGKLNSYPDMVDSDNDAIDDPDDPKPMEYTITDRTLAFVEGLSYTNLEKFVGKTVGYAMDNGVKLDNISKKTAQYLKDAVIVYANDSAKGYWKDFWDSGLGIVALKFERKTEPTVVVFALRGTEPDDDLANDAATDLVLGVGWDSFQSRNAFSAYKEVATNRKYDYYITGHSLGGRLAQDVLYKTYNANEGSWLSAGANIPTPVHSATFNALGYNKLVYATLENDVLRSYKDKLTNYYYWLDLVGEGLGKSGVYKRAGVDVELLCRDIDGNYIRDKEFTNWINVRDNDNHGIVNFHEDYDLLYTSSHSWNYWAD